MPSPAADSHSPHLSTAAPGVSMETEHNVLRAQIPTQVRWDEAVTMFYPLADGLSDVGHRNQDF